MHHAWTSGNVFTTLRERRGNIPQQRWENLPRTFITNVERTLKQRSLTLIWPLYTQLFQLRWSPNKAEKLNTSAKDLLESLSKPIPARLSRSYSTFPLCSGTTLMEIAVYISEKKFHMQITTQTRTQYFQVKNYIQDLLCKIYIKMLQNCWNIYII
jgi:hypothetical protein